VLAVFSELRVYFYISWDAKVDSCVPATVGGVPRLTLFYRQTEVPDTLLCPDPPVLLLDELTSGENCVG
jgi:hypothetical protein